MTSPIIDAAVADLRGWRTGFGFILATLTLDMMAMAIVLPVLPRLVEGLVHGNTILTAHVFGIFGAAWAAMQFLASPVLGALSDRYGRRPVILLSCFGQAVDFTIMALAPSVAWLLVGRLLSGVSSANVAAANAYIADVTPPDRYAASFGLAGLAAALGFVIGPALGGLLGEISLRLPFWFAAALSLANFGFGMVVIRESLAPEARVRLNARRLNPFHALEMIRRASLKAPALIYGTAILAQQAIPSVLILYLQFRFGWTPYMIGIILTAAGIGFGVVGGLLVGPVVRWWGAFRALNLGLAFGALGFVIFGLAPDRLWFWIGVPVISFWALSAPALQGLMAHRIGANEQGRLQGLLASLSGLAALVGPLLFTSIYAACIGGGAAAWISGIPLLLGALLLVAALVIALGSSLRSDTSLR